MAVRTGRLVVLAKDEDHGEDTARIRMQDLDDHIANILDIATTLDAAITLSLRELGADPDEPDSDLHNGPMILEMVHCRNLAEGLYDELQYAKDTALAAISREGQSLS